MVVHFQITLPPYGHAEFSMYPRPDRPEASITVSDGGRHRFLLTSDRVIQDEREPVAVSYPDLLSEYLEQLPAAVAEFESLLRRPAVGPADGATHG